MSRNFSAKNILLGSGLLSATGNTLFLNGNAFNSSSSGLNSLNSLTGNVNLTGAGNINISVSNQLITVSGDTGVYANFATTANLALTGQQAWTAANNNSVNLSGNLTQTGIFLMALISAASAGVSSLNGVSGVVSLNGAGTNSIYTSGQTIIISGRPVNASGEITGLFSSIFLNTGVATGLLSAGEIHWNSSLGTADLGLIDNNTLVTHLGQDTISYVRNVDTGTIYKGQAVYLFGAQGDKPTVRLASNTGETTSTKTLGLLMEDITVGNLGYVKEVGVIENLDLSIYNAGDVLWLGSSPGSYTIDKPIAPLHSVFIGVVTRPNAGNGQVYVKVQNGYELDEIHNVRITGLANGQILYYNSGSGIWYNANFDHSDGINLSGNLTQTGVALGSKIDSLSGFSVNVVSGGLENRIFATGNSAVVHANGIGSIISGNLTQTGVALINRDLLISGLLTTGLANTGQAAWTAAQNNAINLSGNLTSTGATLDSKINSLSGFVGNISGGLEARIFQTGAANITYSTNIGINISGTIALTGQQTINYANSIGVSTSGTIVSSGNAAIAHANGIGSILSGNLTSTGITLDSKINSLSGFTVNIVSGGLETRIAFSGQTAWTHSQNNALNLSGNLQLTGSNLQSQINNITAGTGNVLTNVVFTTGIQYIVGTKYFIGNTYIDNLFVTGSQTVINTQDLYVADNWITLNATGGARDSAIFISTGLTGSSSTGGVFGFDVPSNTWRFGLGSQQTDLVTLPTVASGEAVIAVDSKVNSLSGFTTNISGAIDTRLIATGNAAIAHANGIGFIISGNLTVTGSTLDSKINSVSGWALNVVSGGLETRISLTGNAAISHANGIGSIISGNLTQTGVNLLTTIINTGNAAINFSIGIGSILSGNLTQTGVSLGAKIDSLSGYSNNIFVQTGTILAYTTGILTGADKVYINHLNYTFSTIPKISVELDLTNSFYIYAHAVSGRSNTGFYLLFSDIIEETGIFANVIAKI